MCTYTADRRSIAFERTDVDVRQTLHLHHSLALRVIHCNYPQDLK